MTRFELMPESEARKIVDRARRALRAILSGDKKSEDARGYSFQVETYEDRLAAYRRLRPVVTDDERAHIAQLAQAAQRRAWR